MKKSLAALFLLCGLTFAQTLVPVKIVDCPKTTPNLGSGIIEIPFVVGNAAAGPYALACIQLDPALFKLATGASGAPVITLSLPSATSSTAAPVYSVVQPAGTIDGTNTTFTITCPNSCVASQAISVYQNGLFMQPMSSTCAAGPCNGDYTLSISGNTITIVFATPSIPQPSTGQPNLNVGFWHT
jgi:hypothetical protein